MRERVRGYARVYTREFESICERSVGWCVKGYARVRGYARVHGIRIRCERV